MAKSRKMSSSLKSAGDAWRNHVANVAKTEGVKYGKAMSLASKGKYGAEWKKIKAGLGSGKKAASAAVGGMAMNPAPVNQAGGNVEPAEEFEKSAPAPAMQGGRRRRTRKAKRGSRKGKQRGGVVALVV